MDGAWNVMLSFDQRHVPRTGGMPPDECAEGPRKEGGGWAGEAMDGVKRRAECGVVAAKGGRRV